MCTVCCHAFQPETKGGWEANTSLWIPRLKGTHLEHFVGQGLAPIPPPFRHHQESCHLGISAVGNCQRFVAASAEPRAGSKVELRLSDSHHLLRA